MKKAFLAAIACAALAAGCATQSTIVTTFDKEGKAVQTTEKLSDYAMYAKAQQEPKERPKLFNMTCEPSCSFKSLEVFDPKSGGSAEVKLAAPPESLGASLIKEAFATLRGAIPYAAATSVLNTAFRKANSSTTTVSTNSTTDSHNSSSTSSTVETTVSASGPGSSAANGGGSATGSAPTTTTTNTNSNSGNRTATGGGTTTGAGGGATTGP